MTPPESGTQYRLEHAGYRAEIASVGASLRTLTRHGRDLVLGFRADEVRPGFSGAILAPWPNRVARGRYEYAGAAQQLPITEPARGHALHGLAAWLDFAATDVSPSAVTLTATIVPQAGYPHRLDVTVVYALAADGLAVSVEALNTGSSVAPVGLGSHPYLVGGAGRVDDWTVRIPAADILLVDESLLPTALTAVDGTRFDFRERHPVGDLFVDHAFTGLEADADGRHRVQVVAADGAGVEMRWGGGLPWLQIHTADNPDPALSRRGLAVEPMSCPPAALNSGTDLVHLEPGRSTAATWSISAL